MCETNFLLNKFCLGEVFFMTEDEFIAEILDLDPPKKKDLLDKQWELKKFFKSLFNEFKFEKDEYIRVLQTNSKTDFKKATFFNDVDELISFTTNKHRVFNNTYFNLCTTNGKNGDTNSLMKRYVLGFDFDKKDYANSFNHRHVMEKFKNLGLWYHALVDSGNGYHAYMVIEPTTDLKKVEEVQKSIATKLNSDIKATLRTQVLRVPYTFNVKAKAKEVKIISQFDRKSIKKYDINKLHKRFGQDNFRESNNNVFTATDSNYPPCVANALKNGSKVGNRNMDLFNIVVALKQRGSNLNQIKYITAEWNRLNEQPLPKIEQEVERIYSKYNGYLCNGCNEEDKNGCKSYAISDFNLEQYKENIIHVQNKVGKQCRKAKGVIEMNGNELFIYNVLVNNGGFAPLTIDLITERITDRKTNKCALGINTLRKSLKGLEDKGYISICKGSKKHGIKDTYAINRTKITNENSFRMSYFINLCVIWGRITTTELKVYTHMRYLHHQEVLNGTAKGNIFIVPLDKLADSTGISKTHLSVYVENLYKNNILDRRAIQKQGNTKQFYYEYKLNM